MKPYYLIIMVFCFFGLIGCVDNPFKKQPAQVTELDTISFENLSKKSYDYLFKQQDSCETKFHINSYEHWFYDQATGLLTFSDSGIAKVIVEYEEVGSISNTSNTWLWSWDNASVDALIKQKMEIVKEYGKRRSFIKLTDAEWKADEVDGWEMTAISSYLLKAKGAYRCPSGDGKLLSYLIYKNIRWANPTSPLLKTSSMPNTSKH